MAIPKYDNKEHVGEDYLNEAKRKMLNKFKFSLQDIAPEGEEKIPILSQTGQVYENEEINKIATEINNLLKKNSEYVSDLETYIIPYEKSKKPEIELKLAEKKKQLDKDLKPFEISEETNKLLYVNALFNMIKLAKERLKTLSAQQIKLEEDILNYNTQKQDIEEGIAEFTRELQKIINKKENPILKYDQFVDKEYTDDEIDKRLEYLQQQLNEYKTLTTNKDITNKIAKKKEEYDLMNEQLLENTDKLETLNIQLEAIKRTGAPMPLLLEGRIKEAEGKIKEAEDKIPKLDIEIEELIKQEKKNIENTDDYYSPNEIKLEEVYLTTLKRLNPFIQGLKNIQQMEKIIQEYKDKGAPPEEIQKMEEELQNVIDYMQKNEEAVFPGLPDGLKTAMIELNKYKQFILRNQEKKKKKLGKTGIYTPEELKKIKFFENNIRTLNKELQKIRNILFGLENKLKVINDAMDINNQTIEYVLSEAKKEFGVQTEEDLLKIEDGYKKVLGTIAITIIKIQNKYFVDKKKLEEDIINERSVFTVSHTKIDKDHLYEFDKLLKKIINNFKVINDEFNSIIGNSNYLNSSIFDDLLSSYTTFKSNYKSLYDKLYNKKGALKLLESQLPGTTKDPSRMRFSDLTDNIKKLFELLNIFDSSFNKMQSNYNPQRTTIKENLKDVRGFGYFVNRNNYLPPKFL